MNIVIRNVDVFDFSHNEDRAIKRTLDFFFCGVIELLILVAEPSEGLI